MDSAIHSLTVSRIPAKTGIEFIRKHHYSHGCHNGPLCWGLFDGETLVGALAIATPCSENVRASVFGVEYKQHVTELHRLVVLDGYGKNTESYFISKVLRDLYKQRPDLWAVLSFADATEGHVGTIYQATNAIYTGRTQRAWFYLDGDRLRHPRQNGINISADDARKRGWSRVRREGKYRYLFLLPTAKTERRRVRRLVIMPSLPYPKKESLGE